MKKKVIDLEETLCLCGDSRRVHTKMNKKSWDRLNKQIKEFEESGIQNNEKFWTEFLNEGSQDEWKCSECDCDTFKMDNLRYLEEKYNEKIKQK